MEDEGVDFIPAYSYLEDYGVNSTPVQNIDRMPKFTKNIRYII